MARLVLVCLIVLTGVLPALAQQPYEENEALALLWDEVHAQPADFSVACMPLATPSRTVLYNSTEAFPLASVYKLLIFVEYARQVAAGIIPTDEMVPIEVLNLYDVPRSNAGAHQQFLAEYPADVTALSLWDVAANGMIQYSSNAASDYVLARLGAVDWGALYWSLGVTGTGYPLPFGVVAMLMDNHETGPVTIAGIPSLSVAEAATRFERFVLDPDWRAEEIAYRASRDQARGDWAAQALVLQRFTVTGTTQDFLNVLDSIYDQGGPLSENTKQMVRWALLWQDNGYVNNLYREYGSKLGYYVGGTLTLVAYGLPHEGVPVISVTFLRNVSRPMYRDMRELDSIGELAHWMNHNACEGLLDAIYGDSP